MIDRITITGADDSIRFPHYLGILSNHYPIVEWGILLSKNNMGSNRFPSRNWIDQLITLKYIHGFRIACHLCGKWVRDLMIGEPTIMEELPKFLEGFDRIQLNFHAQKHNWRREGFAFLKSLGKPVIFQWDGTSNELLFFKALEMDINIAPLFDISGGAGIVPKSWPYPVIHPLTKEPFYCGYAGGLGPDNLIEEMEKITAAAGDTPIWIDMETKVRSNDDALFDLKKVETVLEVGTKWIEGRKK